MPGQLGTGLTWEGRRGTVPGPEAARTQQARQVEPAPAADSQSAQGPPPTHKASNLPFSFFCWFSSLTTLGNIYNLRQRGLWDGWVQEFVWRGICCVCV